MAFIHTCRRNFPLSNLELYGYLLKQEALSHASEGLAAATTTSTSTRSAHGICHHHEPPLPGNSNNGTGTQPCEADMQSDPVLPADLCCEDTASDGNTTAAVAGPSASSELIVGASSGQGFAYEQVSVPSAY